LKLIPARRIAGSLVAYSQIWMISVQATSATIGPSNGLCM
jgi:hypothetical protein